MVKKNKVTLRDDGELNYELIEPKYSRFGRLKKFVLVFVIVLITLICEPFIEDLYLEARCDSTELVDVVSNLAIIRAWPQRTSDIAGFVDSGKRHVIHDSDYDRYMNDCWVKIDVEGTTGWLLTLMDKH